MRKVLIVSYSFPPCADSGVYRTLRYTKHLRKFGWEPVVLTVKNYSYARYDEKLIQQLPDKLEVYRSYAFDPIGFLVNRRRKRISSISRANTGKEQAAGEQKTISKKLLRMLYEKAAPKLFIPDERVGWVPFAIHRALSIINVENIDIVYTTGSPWSTHLIGYFLKMMTGIPWVADYRDPWTLTKNVFESLKPEFLSKFDQFLIQRFFQTCTLSIVVNHRIKKNYLLKYPQVKADKIAVIYNGFDPCLFHEAPKDLGEFFTITFTGTLAAMEPEYFLMGLSKAALLNPEFRENAKVLFVGETPDDFQMLLKRNGIQDMVATVGVVSKKESIGYQLSSDVLLFLISHDAGCEMFTSGKIFEYLASGKPVLGLLPDGDARDIILEAGCGLVVSQYDTSAVSNALLQLYGEFKSGELSKYKPRPEVVSRFTDENLTRQLASYFDEII